MRSRFPIYNQLLRLYPREYREHFAPQMLQTLGDMLDDQPSHFGRIGIWMRVIMDLPMSVMRQNVFALEHNLTHETPGFIKRNGMVSATLLIPFIGALCANALNKVFYNHSLFNSWLWSSAILKTWVLFLPMIALAIATLTYGYFVMTAKEKRIHFRTTIRRTWPVLIPLCLACGILMLVQFHDSAHCFLSNPLHYGTSWHRIMQCAQRG